MKKKLLAVALAATMVVSSAITALAVDVKDTISGDLTVTDFFGEKTDAVELKSGDSYTFKFNNKCNGTNNYNNFVMAITGAIGDAYTGADQEVLIIRADNWGWGGGMSDFVAPDQTTGNPLVFETNVGEDWASWLAAAQAGFDCTVKISRDGNTLAYEAQTGDYTFKTTATSGVALPDSCYVFFTGEQCTLTGISTTKEGAGSIPPANNNGSTGGDNGSTGGDDGSTGGDDGSTGGDDGSTGGDTSGSTGGDTSGSTGTTGGTTAPATGDPATTAAVLAVMIAAAGAVVVLKRKKVSE